MNIYDKRKLGIQQTDLDPINTLENKIESESPILLQSTVQQSTDVDNNKFKIINIGTLRKPVNINVLYSKDESVYIDTDINRRLNSKGELGPEKKYYFAQATEIKNTNGELINYQPGLKSLDPDDPYDPLFASFNRMTSFKPQLFISGSTTGIRQGDQEAFFSIFNSGFAKTNNIIVKGAGSDVNGSYAQVGLDYYGRPVYRLLVAPPNSLEIERNSKFSTSPNTAPYIRYKFSNVTNPYIFSQVGNITGAKQLSGQWVIDTDNEFTSFTKRGYLYALNRTDGINDLPTGSWFATGVRVNFTVLSGKNPAPTSSLLELDGFFKLASTRKSYNVLKMYGINIGNTGIATGSTSGVLPTSLPGFEDIKPAWITYPHAYQTTSYPAFNTDLIVVPKGDSNLTTGIKDLLIISTGISTKKIIYVSPHKPYSFVGFWAELTPSSRIPISGISGSIVNTRDVFKLTSGNLLSVSSEDNTVSGLQSYFGYDILSGIPSLDSLYNVDQVKLQQSIPLKNTLFYKLYEPIYRKDSVNTGTWNGVIPSGTPFQIEILRTKNDTLGIDNNFQFNLYSKNYFTLFSGYTITESGVNEISSGVFESGIRYNYIVNDNTNEYLNGHFEGKATLYSQISSKNAEYLAKQSAYKKMRSKLLGTLWDKGFIKTNSKVNKMIKLFNSGRYPENLYRYDIISESGNYIEGSGILTSAGIRQSDGSIIRPDFAVKIQPTLIS
jgi:hypothetical protein